ncbi:hypothetical protein [Paraburkholderia sp. RL17-337-BIB-A]|uniref:hypothetical protein n=1 Tax=Paraburkholderia sp. RL17-337-BIB-A TaxID=3031636 RepID=UPI0038B87A12
MIIDPQPFRERVHGEVYEESQRYYTDDAMADIGDAGADYPSRDLQRALSEAARLIDVHDDGSVAYYESLDPDVIGEWVFGSSWNNPDRYDAKNVALLRDILTLYCDVMRCASVYANHTYDDTWRLLNDENWLDTLGFSERAFAIDSLRHPGLRRAAQAIIERRRFRSRLCKHDSARQAQHSRLTPVDWPELFEPVEPTEDTGTYGRVLYEELPERIQDLIDEQSVLVIRCDSLNESEHSALTRAASKLIFGIDVSGKPATFEVFAGGLLRIPVIANRNLLKEIRSHLTVVYVFADYALLIEYPWRGMTGKARIASAESLEIQAFKNPALVPSTVTNDLLPCRFIVNRVEGLPTSRLDLWADDVPF